MSPNAGRMLVEEIAPRLRAAIPSSVRHIGCEDPEELIQDAIAAAAAMLVRLEEQGKTVTPGNVAYYVILHSKSGRRSTGSSRVDVMASQTQLCGVSAVHSFEEEIGLNEEFDGPCTLGELLSNTGDDPSMQAARNLDWEEFLGGADKKHRLMLGDLVDGNGAAKSLKKKKLSYPEIARLKGELAFNLKEHMGQEILADALRPPAWRASLMVERERAACRR
jgi:hypothetical protein